MDVYKTFGLSEYDRERESGRVVGGKVCVWVGDFADGRECGFGRVIGVAGAGDFGEIKGVEDFGRVIGVGGFGRGAG